MRHRIRSFDPARSLGAGALALAVLVAACSSPVVPTSPTPSTAAGAPTPEPAPTPDPVPTPVVAPATARYRVTFDSTWSTATHPVEFPAANAHYSAMIGGTHNGSVAFWRSGSTASEGIKAMAERGATIPLSEEIAAAIAAGAAERTFGPGRNLGTPGTDSLEFEISQSFPLVTLVSMIAPSPDWFVGVAGLALFENGQWTAERRVSLVPWDAGSDSGVTYTSPDLVTAPLQPITPILTAPLSPGGVVTALGTFTFVRLGT